MDAVIIKIMKYTIFDYNICWTKVIIILSEAVVKHYQLYGLSYQDDTWQIRL